MTDLHAQGAELVSRLKAVCRDLRIEVLSAQPGTLIDDHRGGAFATATLSLTDTSALLLAKRLHADVEDDLEGSEALRRALLHQRIGAGVTTSDDRTQVGLVNLTAGLTEQLIEALTAR